MGNIFGPSATILAFLIGLFIFVAKIKFVRRVVAARTDVDIFNNTLALCLVASGEIEIEIGKVEFCQVWEQWSSFPLQFGFLGKPMER